MVIELIKQYPLPAILIFSLAVTFFTSIITKLLTNQERMKEIKAKQKEYQKQIKEFKHDAKKVMGLQKEMMQHSMELMKHSFKPMLITMLPLLAFFWWLRGVFAETTLAGTWIWWYIGSSIALSIMIRKILKIA